MWLVLLEEPKGIIGKYIKNNQHFNRTANKSYNLERTRGAAATRALVCAVYLPSRSSHVYYRGLNTT